MTPDEAISMLERQLRQHGQDVVFRRYTAPTGTPRPKVEKTVRAFIRPLKAEEMVGNIDAKFFNATVNPTELAEFLPLKKNDKIVIGDVENNVELPKPIALAGTPVRIDLVVGG